jgi:hypothetical protein
MRHPLCFGSAIVLITMVIAGCSAAETEPIPVTQEDAPRSPVTCELSDRPERPAPSGWTHPTEAFYAVGDEAAPGADDLEHLLQGDNALVVTYSAELPDAAFDILRDWASMSTATIAVPGETEPAVRAVLHDRQLDCDGLDTTQLDAFGNTRTFGQVEEHDDSH